MKAYLEPLKSWFGYSRRERKATGILIMIIIIILIIRTFVPEKVSSLVITSLEDNGISTLSEYNQKDTAFVYFDPNKASYDTLLLAGFASSQAKTLISYRSKGGKFNKPVDIKKIYGLSDTVAENLIKRIRFEKPENDTITRKYRKNEVVDINHADSAGLVVLRGIGPVLAARIIKFRNLIGGYASTEQLREVYGLSPETFELIRRSVKADTSALRRIDINTCDYKTISELIYLEKFEVSSILKYRELKGRIGGIRELVDNRLITQDKALKIKPYLKFD